MNFLRSCPRYVEVILIDYKCDYMKETSEVMTGLKGGEYYTGYGLQQTMMQEKERELEIMIYKVLIVCGSW